MGVGSLFVTSFVSNNFLLDGSNRVSDYRFLLVSSRASRILQTYFPSMKICIFSTGPPHPLPQYNDSSGAYQWHSSNQLIFEEKMASCHFQLTNEIKITDVGLRNILCSNDGRLRSQLYLP